MKQLPAPCPWCQTGTYVVNDTAPPSRHPSFFVACENDECEACGPAAATTETAVKRWNQVAVRLPHIVPHSSPP